jgi:hypothetical protein
MNERIKELLDEACVYAHSKHFAHVKKFKYVTPDQHSNAQDTMQEKFAELIVRECANMCYKASQESFRLNEVKAGAMGMALKVLMEEHFGIEE